MPTHDLGPARARAASLALLVLQAAGADLSAPVRVLVECGGTRVEYTFARAELGPAPPPGLSPLERAVLRAAGREPLTAKRLAAKLRRTCNTHFRDQLRNLVRRGLLLHTPDGYRLPD